MTRYKIRTPSKAAFEKILSLLRGQTKVSVASDKRRILSTDDMPPEAREAIAAEGAEITEERQYDLDSP